MTQATKFFRSRFTHYTSGKPAGEQPWQVLCESHARNQNSCAQHQVELLDGAWTCQYCTRFDWDAQSALHKTLKHPNFSHVSIRGHERELGVVYHRDPTSPSGVRSAGGFDPFCPAAMKMVRELTGTPNDGPLLGSRAGRGGSCCRSCSRATTRRTTTASDAPIPQR